MEYRQLGGSGFMVPVLGFGTGTFGGGTELFRAWATTDVVGRDYEWELMPLALDQRVSAVVWSPLGWGRHTGKVRRGQPLPATSRLNSKVANDVGRRSRRSTSSRSSMRSSRSHGGFTERNPVPTQSPFEGDAR